MNDKKSYINKIKNWILEIQFEFMENELFLPTGLELSCVPIIIETKDDYTFQGISKNIPAGKVVRDYLREAE